MSCKQNGKDAVNALARFLYNSSVGVGGLFDVAKDIDLEEREADFGQTLRAYGHESHRLYCVADIRAFFRGRCAWTSGGYRFFPALLS